MLRRKTNAKKSRKRFTRTAMKSHPSNRKTARGGYRK